MANKSEATVVKFLKDLGAEFGCKGDIYANTEAQMARLEARVKKLGLKAQDAYEVVTADVKKAVANVEAEVEKTTSSK